MIQPRTMLTIVDNTGAKQARCLQVFKKKRVIIGDTILVSVRKIKVSATQKQKVKKGGVYKALVLRTNLPLKRKNGTFIQFSEHAAILLTQQNQCLGTRLYGPSAQELRRSKQLKVLSMLSSIV